MFYVDQPTAISAMPAMSVSGSAGFFTTADPANSTIVPADWLNMVQVELKNVLALASLTPDQSKTTLNQVATAISTYVDGVLDAYLPLAGGTVTGALTVDGVILAINGAQIDQTLNMLGATPSIHFFNAAGTVQQAQIYTDNAGNLVLNAATINLAGTAIVGTAATGTDTEQVASCAFVLNEFAAKAGLANGLATLDSGGHVPLAQLPASVTGDLDYQGGWNAAANSPPLASGAGTKGYYYKVTVAGTTTLDGISVWNVGDSAVFDGAAWDKFDGTADVVLTFNGRYGAVSLTAADISTAQGYVSVNPASLGTAAYQPSTAFDAAGAAAAAQSAAETFTTANYLPLAGGAISGALTVAGQILARGALTVTVQAGGAAAGIQFTNYADTIETGYITVDGSGNGEFLVIGTLQFNATTITMAPSGAFTVPTAATNDNSGSAANTEWVNANGFGSGIANSVIGGAVNTVYTNSSGRARCIRGELTSTTAISLVRILVNGADVGACFSTYSNNLTGSLSAFIPAGATWEFSVPTGSFTFNLLCWDG